MEESTTTRRGRPRKNSPDNNAAGEGESVIANDVRERKAIDAGFGVQKDNGRSGQGLSFAELVEIVKSKNSHAHRISCVIHHDAEGVVTTDNFGNIRTEKGECGYQLNTGEIVLI